MKLILLYGIPILIVVLLHMFGFTTDAATVDKGKATLHAGESDSDNDNDERVDSSRDSHAHEPRA